MFLKVYKKENVINSRNMYHVLRMKERNFEKIIDHFEGAVI